ncbi:MAG: TM2 domain-containing protein [Gemmatimonadota bacterium]
MTRAATPHLRIDPDFAHRVLGDLYAYRRKRRAVAWVFWIVLGWLGAHRFYLERPGTGVAQMLTGGGLLVWWIADAWRIGRMVDAHNTEQARRAAAGEPPLELAFMPARAVDVVQEPPEWTRKWDQRGRAWRGMRLFGDVLVLMVAGAALGALADAEGGAEGVVAVGALIGVTLLGGQAAWLADIPVARTLVRWSHRLRLFYYFNQPGTPPTLLVRGITGMFLAPFRRRDRAETRLYLELGAAFTLVFLMLDFVEDVAAPLAGTGLAALSPLRLAGVWFQEIFLTLFVIYAFAAPIGAVLTLYLLTRRTHTVPRILGVLTLLFMAMGAGII